MKALWLGWGGGKNVVVKGVVSQWRFVDEIFVTGAYVLQDWLRMERGNEIWNIVGS